MSSLVSSGHWPVELPPAFRQLMERHGITPDQAPTAEQWQAMIDSLREYSLHSITLNVEYGLFFQLSPVGLGLVALDGRYLRVNRAFCEIVGYSEAELLTMSIRDLTHPDDMDENTDLRRQLIAGEIPSFATEKRLLHKDGSARYVRIEVTLGRGEGGEPLYTYGSTLDLTRDKENEEHIRRLYQAAERQAHELLLLQEVIEAVASKLELADVIRTIVNAIADAFRYDLVSIYLLKDNTLTLSHQSGTLPAIRSLPISQGVIGRVARTGRAALIRDSRSDPDYLSAMPVIASEACAPLRQGSTVVGVLNVEAHDGRQLSEQDVLLVETLAQHVSVAMERARLYTELRLSHERSQLVMDNVREVIFQTDVDGRWTFLNRAWTELTGHAVAETLGQDSREFMPPDEYAENLRVGRLLLKHDRPYHQRRTLLLHQDGRLIPVDAQVRALFGPDGRGMGITGTLTDARERLEAQRRELDLALKAHTVETLRGFLYALSHDLRTPISVLKTSLYLLRRRLGDQPQNLRYVDTLDQQATFLARVIEDMMDMSQLDEEVFQFNFLRVNINGLIRDVLVSLQPAVEQHGHTLTFLPDNNARLLQADQVMIGKVIRNLVNNAIEYTPDGGAIVVRTVQEPHALRLEVQDNGIGIDPTEQALIFERFYKTDKSRQLNTSTSTGLGLPIVKKIVDAHQGSIEVQSAPGAGSTFSVRLPSGG